MLDITNTDQQHHANTEKTMKYQKLVDDLNNLLDLAAETQKKRQKKLKYFFEQLQSEEQRLLKKIKKEDKKANCKKLKKELHMVHQAYDLLGST